MAYIEKACIFFHIGKMEHSERRRRGGVEGAGQQSQCVSLRRIKAAASEMHSNNGHIRVRERACLLFFMSLLLL